MRLTVAICTWNRVGLLARTLERLTDLRVPPDVAWELLVVDNNCTDGTSDVLSRFTGRLPLRIARESTPGLSNARNRAVDEATGEFILWTDDDVRVEPDWMAAYARAIEAHPSACVFGGPVEPWFEGEAPAWLRRTFDEVSTAFAVRDLSTEPFRLGPDRNQLPFGANFAVRLDEQRRHLYDPELGRRPDSMIGAEETSVLLAILEEGGEGWWVPEARVRHFIPAARQTVSYLRGFYEGQGEHAGRTGLQEGRLTVFGKPAWMWKEAALAEISFRVRRTFLPPERWIRDLKRAAFLRGRLRAVSVPTEREPVDE